MKSFLIIIFELRLKRICMYFLVVLLLSVTSLNAQVFDFEELAKWDTYKAGHLELTSVIDSSATDGQAIKINTLTSTANWWESGMQSVEEGQALAAEAGSQYKISFQYRADQPRDIRFNAKERPTGTYGSDDVDYFSGNLPQATTEYQSFTYTFTAAAAVPSTIHYQFPVGGDSIPVYIDNITIEKITEPVDDDGYIDNLDYFDTFSAGDLFMEVVGDQEAVGGESLKVNTLLLEDNWWNAGVQSIEEKAPRDSIGKTFTVSFRYRADAQRKLWFSVKSRPRGTFGSDDITHFSQYISDPTASYQDFTYTFTSETPDDIDATVHIQFFVGGDATPLYLDAIKVYEITAPQGDEFYVNPLGNDRNSGQANTAEEAWKTISHALNVIPEGSTLYISDGLYQENGLELNDHHATPEKPTRIVSLNTWGADIENNSEFTAVLNIRNSSYIEIEGIEGYNSINKGTGVAIVEGSHHITVKDSYIHDCGCGGVEVKDSDYLTIEGNIVRDNAKGSNYNCSGISIYHPVAYDSLSGYHIIIRNNIAFENECRLPFTPGGFSTPTDGNGIILDDFEHTQSPSGTPPYREASLVENNLSFNNGGNGIKVYLASNVTIQNNTLWHNNYVLEEYFSFFGDLSLQNVLGDISVYNNIVGKTFGQQGSALYLRGNSELNTANIGNNVIVGRTLFEEIFPNLANNQLITEDRQSYPKFAQIFPEDFSVTAVEEFTSYFGLRSGSPALNTGDNNYSPDQDLNGNARPIDLVVDIGTYEGIVEGVGPLPEDELQVAEIQSSTIAIDLDGIRDGAYFGIEYVINKYEEGNENPEDLSANWTGMWNEDYLFLHINVKDDQLQNDSSSPLDNDAVEIYIDADNTRGNIFDDNDFHFIVERNKNNVVELLRGEHQGVEAVTTENDKDYAVEIRIPWSTLRVTAQDLLLMGIDLHIRDDDDGNGIDNVVMWQSQKEDVTPDLFGNLELIKVLPPAIFTKVRKKPVVDGIRDVLWDTSVVLPVNKEIQPIITNDQDLSAVWSAVWDEEHLYFYISVEDDDLQNDSTNWYEDDGVEIYIDADNSKNQFYDENDYQITVGWNDNNVIVDTKGNLGPGASAFVLDTEKGYDVEVSIPWSALKVTPQEGLFTGVDIHVIDDDTGGGRSGKLAWFTDIDESYRNPALFGIGYLNGIALSGKEIPGKIEAENYDVIQGEGFAAPSLDDDTDALVNIGLRDKIKYEVHVEKTGMYQFSYRLANKQRVPVMFTLKQQEKILHKVVTNKIPTGQWVVANAYAYLEKGTDTIEIHSKGKNWKLNWFHPTKVGMELPGKIPAPAFNKKTGNVIIMPSVVQDSSATVRFLGNSSSVSYPVKVTKTGMYKFTYYVNPSFYRSKLTLNLGEDELHTVNINYTRRNFRQWQQVTGYTLLNEGDQSLQIVGSPGLSIAWWKAEYSNEIQNSSEEIEALAMQIYPNPTSGRLQLEGIDEKIIKITVYDAFGLLHKEFTKKGTHNLDLGTLKSGLYVIRVQTEKKTFQQKVILRK